MPQSHRLVPLSALAQQLCAQLKVEMLELTNVPCAIGRGVAGTDGVTLNAMWAQFSSRHCRILCLPVEQGEPTWYVEDHSTNGTWINDIRVPKGSSLPMHSGDVLRLSSGTSSNVLEFRFESVDTVQDLAPPSASTALTADAYAADASARRAATHTPPGTLKRKASEALGAQGHDAGTKLRASVSPRADAGAAPEGQQATGSMATAATTAAAGTAARDSDGHALGAAAAAAPFNQSSKGLAQHEKLIQDLQRKLAASRRQVDEVTGEANKLRQELSQKALEAEERLQEAERRATQRSAAFAEALQKELDATRMRAAETAAKLAEVQAKVQAEVQAKGKVEEALAAMQVELEAQRGAGLELQRAQAELQECKAQLTALKTERDQAEHRRLQEAEARAKAQEELQAQARHAAAQEEAKEAAQRAAEQASAQLREALGQVQVLRAAQLASQSELRAAQEQLYGARRTADGLEEQLQAHAIEGSFKRVRAEELSQLCTHAADEVTRLLHRVQAQAAELAAAPRLDLPASSSCLQESSRAGEGTATAAGLGPGGEAGGGAAGAGRGFMAGGERAYSTQATAAAGTTLSQQQQQQQQHQGAVRHPSPTKLPHEQDHRMAEVSAEEAQTAAGAARGAGAQDTCTQGDTGVGGAKGALPGTQPQLHSPSRARWAATTTQSPATSCPNQQQQRQLQRLRGPLVFDGGDTQPPPGGLLPAVAGAAATIMQQLGALLQPTTGLLPGVGTETQPPALETHSQAAPMTVDTLAPAPQGSGLGAGSLEGLEGAGEGQAAIAMTLRCTAVPLGETQAPDAVYHPQVAEGFGAGGLDGSGEDGGEGAGGAFGSSMAVGPDALDRVQQVQADEIMAGVEDVEAAQQLAGTAAQERMEVEEESRQGDGGVEPLCGDAANVGRGRGGQSDDEDMADVAGAAGQGQGLGGGSGGCAEDAADLGLEIEGAGTGGETGTLVVGGAALGQLDQDQATDVAPGGGVGGGQQHDVQQQQEQQQGIPSTAGSPQPEVHEGDHAGTREDASTRKAAGQESQLTEEAGQLTDAGAGSAAASEAAVGDGDSGCEIIDPPPKQAGREEEEEGQEEGQEDKEATDDGEEDAQGAHGVCEARLVLDGRGQELSGTCKVAGHGSGEQQAQEAAPPHAMYRHPDLDLTDSARQQLGSAVPFVGSIFPEGQGPGGSLVPAGF